MKSGICPKCAASEVYRQGGSQLSHEMIEFKSGLISKGAAPDKYICMACGYLEYYLPLTEDTQVIRSNWERVPTQS